MWECQKCHERHDGSFEVCWKCGTSKAGMEDPSFRPADQIDLASFVDPAEDTAIAAGAPPPSAMPAANVPDYEFSRAQKGVIAGLASSMKFVGVISLLGGCVLFFAGIGNFSILVQGILALIVGGFTIQAAGAFREIVDSPGNEIGNLMKALSALWSLYRLQVALLCLALGILVLLVVMNAGH